jgi:DNA-binding response OmpR family regulator
MVADYLSGKGYDVVEATDGIQGLDRGLSSAPNIIILDVVMPGIDGFKLCQLLREKGVKTPIIMLTEKATIEDKVTGFSFTWQSHSARWNLSFGFRPCSGEAQEKLSNLSKKY